MLGNFENNPALADRLATKKTAATDPFFNAQSG